MTIVTYADCSCCGSEATVACCANTLPTTLYITLSGGGCDGTGSLIWDSSSQKWLGSVILSAGVLDVEFWCAEGTPNTFMLSLSNCHSTMGGLPLSGGSCDPLDVGTGAFILDTACCGSAATVDISITE